MNRSFSARVRGLLQRRTLKSRLASLAKVVSCVAVFCISYILVAPVITEEWEPICGMEEHVHTAECYQEVWVPDEVNTDNDDNSDNIENIENDIENESTEPQTETQQVLTCDLVEGHTHDSGCYERVQGDLICTVEGTEEEPHEHDDSCYDWTEELVCTETEGHTHDESCYEAVEVEVESESQPETKPVESEEQGGESGHYETILVCELPEHTHNDSCYHISDDENKAEYVCGFATNHTHTADCYFENGDLKCTVPEHIHTDKCLAEGAATADKADGTKRATTIDETFEYEDDFVKATVKVQGNVFLPEIQSDDNTDAEDQAVENETIDNETVENGETADDETVENIEDNAAETSDDHNGLELVVTESDSDEKYTEFTTLAEEDGEIMMLQVLDYSLMMGDEEISLDACTVDVQVEAKAELQQMMDAPANSAMYASEDETAEPTENNSMMELTAYTEDNGTMAYAVVELDNPSFTVQYYAYLNRAVMTDYDVGDGKTLPKSYNTDFPAKNMVAIINTNSGSTAATARAIGGKLPKNKEVEVKDVTRWQSPNDNKIGVLTIENGKIKTDEKLTEIYMSEQLTYKKAPGLMYFNIVNQNSDSQYTLEQIWVLKEEYRDNKTIANSAEEIYTKDETYWKKIDYSSSIRFTNRKQTADVNPDYILIDENAVIRLVYDTKNTTKDFDANFYDYDISDGYIYSSYNSSNKTWSGQKSTSSQTNSAAWYTKTSAYGINAAATTGSGARLAFGNGDHSDYGKISWNGKYTLNKANLKGFMICTYGLVQRLDGTYIENEKTGKLEYHGNMVYSDGVAAPNLFNEGSANGKKNYDNKQYSLKFNRVGDTYTLKAVNGASTAQNLDQLNHPSYKVGNTTTTHNHIWTNNFWPMDSAPSWGADTHDMKFGSAEWANKRKNQVGNLPTSDDGKDHNSYFGMQYAVTFDLSSSYVGPLEYFFFGDDDMWVFLDDKLVCDIGGVHTSVGQYVNLWDYIDRSELLEEDGKTPRKVDKVERDENGKVIKDENGNPIIVYETDKDGNYKLDENGNMIPEKEDKVKTYTLNFYYTERGASGSTCWMQFTLPTVVGVNLDRVLDEQLGDNTGSVSIQKKVNGIETNEWFEFKIDYLADNYAPMLYNANGELIRDEELIEKSGYIIGGKDGKFKIRPGDTLVLRGIPANTQVTVTELGEFDEKGSSLDGYQSFVTVNGVEQNTAPDATLTIKAGKRTEVVYTNVSSYELPATGGMGTEIFYIVGAALCLTALGLGVIMNRRKELN